MGEMATTEISPTGTPMKSGRRAAWKWIGVIAMLFLVSAVVAARFAIVRAAPILHTRIIQTLSTRFGGKVELATFDVSVNHGIEVSGGGLKIFGATDPEATLLSMNTR